MKILWKPNYDLKGNGYGYTTHQKNLKAALERRQDVSFVSEPEDADVIVDINTPPAFQRIEGKLNVLYTMYECATLPPDWLPYIHEADLLIVPCEHNYHLFRKYTDTPIEVVWEGMNPDKFSYVEREFPQDRPFVFLWIGASNPRKGYKHASLAWGAFCNQFPEYAKNCSMIMKTTQITKEERLLNIPVTLPGGGKAPTFFDSRDYSLDELTDLYKFAHAFVFPTMGEGWGLTLHEAMATGLPAIYTPYSAPADWVPRKYAYPVRFKMQKIETHKNLKNGGIVKHHTTEAASAYIGDIVQKMRRIYTRYDEALDKGRKASQRVRRITWDASAASFIEKIAPYSEARDGEESLPSTGSARRVYA